MAAVNIVLVGSPHSRKKAVARRMQQLLGRGSDPAAVDAPKLPTSQLLQKPFTRLLMRAESRSLRFYRFQRAPAAAPWRIFRGSAWEDCRVRVPVAYQRGELTEDQRDFLLLHLRELHYPLELSAYGGTDAAAAVYIVYLRRSSAPPSEPDEAMRRRYDELFDPRRRRHSAPFPRRLQILFEDDPAVCDEVCREIVAYIQRHVAGHETSGYYTIPRYVGVPVPPPTEKMLLAREEEEEIEPDDARFVRLTAIRVPTSNDE